MTMTMCASTHHPMQKLYTEGWSQPAAFPNRIDCHTIPMQEVRHELQQELQASSWQAQAEGRVVDQVPEVPQAMLLHGGGQQDVDYAPAQGEARMPC